MTMQDSTTAADFQSSSSDSSDGLFEPKIARRYKIDGVFSTLTWVAIAIAIVVLVVLIIDVVYVGAPRLFGDDGGIPFLREKEFLWSFSSRKAEEAGIKSGLVGSIWLLIVTAVMSFPIGVASGIFLEEFSGRSWYAKVIEVNIGNLAAVPAIIYGLLGLAVFVNIMRPITGGSSVIAGALTMTLLILPIIIVATREALRAVPISLRQAGYALGANTWQVTWSHVLPQAMPGILTGTILALSRAIGEASPLLVIGAAVYIPFLPELSVKGLQSDFTALPIQIFNWSSRPQKEFEVTAAAGIVVLLVVLLAMNAGAIYLRNRLQKDQL